MWYIVTSDIVTSRVYCNLFIYYLQNKPFATEKGSPIDLDLGPKIDRHAGKNYRTIKEVNLCKSQTVLTLSSPSMTSSICKQLGSG